MDKCEVFERVCEVVSDVLGVNVQDISSDSRFAEDLGAELVQGTELATALAEEFEVEVEEELALQTLTVGDAVDLIAEAIDRESPQ